MWTPDVLGESFEQLTLELGDDNEGEVVATLVRHKPGWRFELHKPPASGYDVLYVHGWSDYFFQKHLAEFWSRNGARFYALDLRKYGRSLREYQTPGYITDLEQYDQDIEAALHAMQTEEKGRGLIVMGHSTGGLTLSLWAARNQERVAAVVLNSPWLEFQARQAARMAIAPIAALHAKYRPLDELPSVDLGFYTRTVSSAFDGRWDYEAKWRPERGFGLHPAWINAVLSGHAKVALGLNIEAPIITLLSTRSMLQTKWDPEMAHADVALDVEAIAERATDLGHVNTIVRLKNAMHDVTLSETQVWAKAMAELRRWMHGYLVER